MDSSIDLSHNKIAHCHFDSVVDFTNRSVLDNSAKYKSRVGDIIYNVGGGSIESEGSQSPIRSGDDISTNLLGFK
jgi:hypothetical protein